MSRTRSMPTWAMSSRRPRNGLISTAPAFAERSAWVAEKQSVWLTRIPLPERYFTALRPSLVRGHLTTAFGATCASSSPSFTMPSKSVATTSRLTSPGTIAQISSTRGRNGRFSLAISEGLVVTPSTTPSATPSLISPRFAVSRKIFMAPSSGIASFGIASLSLDRHARARTLSLGRASGVCQGSQPASPFALIVGEGGVERCPIRDRRPALALDGERAGAGGGRRGLPRIAVALILDEERRREHVAGAGRVDLPRRARAHLVSLPVDKQERAVAVGREDADRRALEPLDHLALLAADVLAAEEQGLDRLQQALGRAPGARHDEPIAGRVTEPSLGRRAHGALGEQGRDHRIDFVEHRRSEERRVGKECRSRWSPYH